jgi:lipid-binding SYLF domain-containing protein
MRVIRIASIALVVALTGTTLAQTGDRAKAVRRVQEASQILNDIMSAPDSGIPSEIIGSADCVAVVPSLLKGGLGFGAQYGRGVASCKTQSGWSAPAFFKVEGGSFGFQIGGQAVDLVMLVMNEQGMRALLSSKFKLGADASVAAGPVGRHAEGMTDWKMRAQVLTYSRARGVFAGVALNGAVIKQDKDSTWDFYGRFIPFKNLLTGGTVPPGDAQPFLATIAKYAGPVPAAPKPQQAKTPATAPSTPSSSGQPAMSGTPTASQPGGGSTNAAPASAAPVQPSTVDGQAQQPPANPPAQAPPASKPPDTTAPTATQH